MQNTVRWAWVSCIQCSHRTENEVSNLPSSSSHNSCTSLRGSCGSTIRVGTSLAWYDTDCHVSITLQQFLPALIRCSLLLASAHLNLDPQLPSFLMPSIIEYKSHLFRTSLKRSEIKIPVQEPWLKMLGDLYAKGGVYVGHYSITTLPTLSG